MIPTYWRSFWEALCSSSPRSSSRSGGSWTRLGRTHVLSGGHTPPALCSPPQTGQFLLNTKQGQWVTTKAPNKIGFAWHRCQSSGYLSPWWSGCWRRPLPAAVPPPDAAGRWPLYCSPIQSPTYTRRRKTRSSPLPPTERTVKVTCLIHSKWVLNPPKNSPTSFPEDRNNEMTKKRQTTVRPTQNSMAAYFN